MGPGHRDPVKALLHIVLPELNRAPGTDGRVEKLAVSLGPPFRSQDHSERP